MRAEMVGLGNQKASKMGQKELVIEASDGRNGNKRKMGRNKANAARLQAERVCEKREGW